MRSKRSSKENHHESSSKKIKKRHKTLKMQNASTAPKHTPENVLKNQFIPSAKIQDLIRTTLNDPSREKIVQLLFQVKEKAEHCYDFELSFWLDKYLQIETDVNLIEAAYLIVNAGNIYDRKVDLFYELVRRSVEQDAECADGKEKKQLSQKTRRKITRQAVSVHDRLYESEMLPKGFKSLPLEKSTELISSNSTKAPTHYFKKWAEYKIWRANHKKKMKSIVPYSTVCDDLNLHPSMWGQSCIEDFDYDDDLDTKRNYRMFTHYMEHRYNTLIPDINFILHFKVKDYIEAEEDEIEAMRILGLPTPPTRQWPPFCNSLYSKELAKQTYNIDSGESAEDYIKKYVAFEDVVLKKKVYEVNNDLLRNAAKAQRTEKESSNGQETVTLVNSVNNLEEMTNEHDVDRPVTPIVADSCQEEEEEEVEAKRPCENIEKKASKESENESVLDSTAARSSIEDSSRNETTLETTLTTNKFDAENETVEITVIVESHTPVKEIETNQERPTITSSLNEPLNLEAIEKSVHDETVFHPPEVPAKIGKKNASTIIAETIKSNLDDNIVIRVSIDEGIAFSELDDIDRAMISPVVELIDIFRPVKEEVLDGEDPNGTVAEITRNILVIDEAYLRCEENFHLPIELLHRAPKIVQNIFRLPVSKLRRKVNFSLPKEFDLYISNRLKRKSNDKPEPLRRTLKLFKLNEQNMSGISYTPSVTPQPEDDFYGFEESDISLTDISWSGALSSTQRVLLHNLTTPSRTISRDSGIGLTSFSDSQITTNSLLNESDFIPIVESSDNTPVPDTFRQDENRFEQLATISEDIDDRMDATSHCGDLDMINDQPQIELPAASNRDEDERVATSIFEQPVISETTEYERSLYDKCKQNVERRTNEMNEMTERIQNWHRHLRPILANSMERHHFDIFAIGTDIINTFSSNEECPSSPPVATLQNVMENHDPSYLSRYFLSMLQLANTNNVAIEIANKSSDEPTALSDVHLKLLSRKRYSVSIEDNIGANIHPSRKRQHSLSDASDAELDTEKPSTSRQSPPKKQICKSVSNQTKNDVNSKSEHAKSPNSKMKSMTKNKLVALQTPNPTKLNIAKCNASAFDLIKSENISQTNCVKAAIITSEELNRSLPTKKDSMMHKNTNEKISNVLNTTSESLSVSRSSLVNSSLHKNVEVVNVDTSKIASKNSSSSSSENENQTLLPQASNSKTECSSASLGADELPPFELIRRHDMEAERILQKYSEIHLQNSYGSDFCETDSSIPENVTISQQNTVQMIRPQIVRTANMRNSLKRTSDLNNDDMDSGIFSEFSLTENSSIIL